MSLYVYMYTVYVYTFDISNLVCVYGIDCSINAACAVMSLSAVLLPHHRWRSAAVVIRYLSHYITQKKLPNGSQATHEHYLQLYYNN